MTSGAAMLIKPLFKINLYLQIDNDNIGLVIGLFLFLIISLISLIIPDLILLLLTPVLVLVTELSERQRLFL